MRSYEIQTFRDGYWKMDSIFDDRDLAIFEAKRIDEGKISSGVKVIEEFYDEASNRTSTRTLFRGGIAKGEKAPKIEKNKASGGTAQSGGKKSRSLRTGQARPQSPKKSMSQLLIMLALIIVVGFGSMIGLKYLSEIFPM